MFGITARSIDFSIFRFNPEAIRDLSFILLKTLIFIKNPHPCIKNHFNHIHKIIADIHGSDSSVNKGGGR